MQVLLLILLIIWSSLMGVVSDILKPLNLIKPPWAKTPAEISKHNKTETEFPNDLPSEKPLRIFTTTTNIGFVQEISGTYVVVVAEQELIAIKSKTEFRNENSNYYETSFKREDNMKG